MKYVYFLLMAINGGYYALSNTPILASTGAVSWINAIIIAIAYAIPLYGVVQNKHWAFYYGAGLSFFFIFALLFNGFYIYFEYILLIINLLVLALLYPAIKSLSQSTDQADN